MNFNSPSHTVTFNDLLSRDCGCLSNSTYLDLVDGLDTGLKELRDALVLSKSDDLSHFYVPNVDIAIDYVNKISTMIVDLKRQDAQSINRLFAVVKYLIYIGGMRKKLAQEVLEELSVCGFIVNRLIGLLTNSAYTCVVNDSMYRQKAYTRLVTSGCIRSFRHKCKGV